MTAEEYEATLVMMSSVGRTVQLLDLDAFLQAIDLAETTGAIIDPTLYRAAMTKMQAIKKMALALREFKRAVLEVKAEFGTEGP